MALRSQISDSPPTSTAGEIAAAHKNALRRWPTLGVPLAKFSDYVMSLPSADTPVDRLHLEDIYLALACAVHVADAIDIFDARFAGILRGLWTNLRIDRDAVDDLLQDLRTKLFTGEAPRITTYAGRGTLQSWVCATAVRMAVSYSRRRGRELAVGDDELLDSAMDQTLSPEIQQLKKNCRSEFAQLLREAIRALPQRDRAILRYHYLDGLSLEEIARFYAVHRATAFRWLDGARNSVLALLRSSASRRLHLTRNELDSMVRLIDSQMDSVVTHCLVSEPALK